MKPYTQTSIIVLNYFSIDLLVFNTNFSSISAISWRSNKWNKILYFLHSLHLLYYKGIQIIICYIRLAYKQQSSDAM